MSKKHNIIDLINHCRNHQHGVVCLSNGFKDSYGKFEILAGYGAKKEYFDPSEISNDKFLLGFVGFDFKNKLHQLKSSGKNLTKFPDFYFFEPQELYSVSRDGTIESNFNFPKYTGPVNSKRPDKWMASTNKNEYLETVNKIQDDIINGVFYEMNYCIHFEANEDGEDPYDLFIELNKQTQSPFAAFVKYNNNFLLCFSPERFLQKDNHTLLAQPIKGTLKKSNYDTIALENFKKSEKERAENIMIVDLMRNDLSRISKFGTVKVEELCELYSFSHVHHLISTVKSEIQSGINNDQIFHATFPMGSMTGAPKMEVLKAIEKYENFARGLYSGSVGYYLNGDFDLNVVIRSLQLSKEKWHYFVGGAIVYDSIAENEYEECLAKLNGIMKK